MANNLDDHRRAVLLNEYSSCQSSIESLDASVWQSAGIIGLVTIGTFSLIVANNLSIFAAAIVGFFSTWGVFTWWRMAIRWWSVRDAKIERMRHIEKDLDVPGQTHYIEFLDRLYDSRSSGPDAQHDDLIRKLSRHHHIGLNRARELVKNVSFERKGPRDALSSFRLLTFFIWIIYIALRLIAPIWKFFIFKVFVFLF